MKNIATRERIFETVLPVFAQKGYHRAIVDAIVLKIGDGEILLPSSEHRAGSVRGVIEEGGESQGPMGGRLIARRAVVGKQPWNVSRC